MPKRDFSYHNCLKILRKAGAKQVSSGAAEELRRTIEQIALDISKRAILFADDGARLKVTAEDVRSAFRELLAGGRELLRSLEE
jgi:histone H3/H4